MTDTTRDAFEAWFLAYRKGTWRPLSSDPRKDMPKHWNTNCEMDCWRGWQAATEQGKPQPLTDEQVQKILFQVQINWAKSPPTHEFAPAFARAIEAAHGITATPQGKI